MNIAHFARLFVFAGLLLSVSQAMGQRVSITLGETNIGSNQVFQITVTVENEKFRDYSDFPEITGFRKSGTSSSTNTNIINGRVSFSQSIIQNYMPLKEGTFTLKNFTMKINGNAVEAKGATIKVGAPIRQQTIDPFADFFGRRDQQSKEYIDVEDNAFFAVMPSAREVFVGEGVTVQIAFYVSMDNKAKMEFYQLGEQLTDILKKIKPSNVWEENFEISQVNPEYVTINNKQYKQFKIYEAVFYPLNTQTLVFPSVGLKMIKYKEAKNPSFFGQNLQEDYKTFFSAEKKVVVKELPPHPLRDQLNVGSYKLKEKVDNNLFETGKSFIYEFKVQGEGNIAGIREPYLTDNGNFIFYPPAINQNVVRGNGVVQGAKSFQYYIEPQEPGEYKLGDYVQWIYFNAKENRYDTLKSDVVLKIVGESKKNAAIASSDMGWFYGNLDTDSNELKPLSSIDLMGILYGAGILLMVGGVLYMGVRMKKNTPSYRGKKNR